MRGQQDGSRRAHRVEDGAHVVHSRFQSRKVAPEVRQAGPALVEQDQPEPSGETFVEAAPMWRLPAVDEVGDVVRDVDQVDVAVADHLVGDRNAAAARVADVERHVGEYS
jgi:hypothetical protein